MSLSSINLTAFITFEKNNVLLKTLLALKTTEDRIKRSRQSMKSLFSDHEK
jgi:hypothetical protein